MITGRRGVVALALLAVLALACGPGAEEDQPEPGQDRTLTLHWFSDQPYKARWAISAERGAKTPEGLNPTGEEISAGGEFTKQLIVGQTPLVITIVVVMSRNYDVEAWVRITENGKELSYQKADRGIRQAITVYHYKPIR